MFNHKNNVYPSFPLFHKDFDQGGLSSSNGVSKAYSANGPRLKLKYKPAWRCLPVESAKKGFYTFHAFLDEEKFYATWQLLNPFRITKLKEHFGGHRPISIGFVICYGDAFYNMYDNNSFEISNSSLNLMSIEPQDRTFKLLREAGFPIVFPQTVVSYRGKDYEKRVIDIYNI